MTADSVAETAKHIEVICINDNQEQDSKTQLVPHERQVIDEIIALWKEDPSTESLGLPKLHSIVKTRHPNWSLSEKRVKTLLKQFGLFNNSGQQFCYASEITSEPDPNLELPEKIKTVMTTKRGKGLYARVNIAKGELIWEEPPYFFIPPLANLTLIKHGKACTFCGKLLTPPSRASSGISALRGLDCNVCTELWCSQTCKKSDTLHVILKHLTGSKAKKQIINSEAFLELEDYCIKEAWNALYAITLIYANILEDKTGEKGSFFRSMARVSQEIRYKALDSSAGSFDSFQGGALFVQEQQESLWREGYKKFSSVFPAATKNDVDYKEFMQMLGCYNINNLDSCVFRIQSHLNHTCNPTTSVETSATRTDGIKVYAARDIKAGEELTTTYVNPSHTVQQRQRELRCNWGFICSCQKCKDDLQLQHRRKSSTAGAAPNNKKDIKAMLDEAKSEIGDQGIELGIPVDYNGERRKSVRFDEKVIAVSE